MSRLLLFNLLEMIFACGNTPMSSNLTIQTFFSVPVNYMIWGRSQIVGLFIELCRIAFHRPAIQITNGPTVLSIEKKSCTFNFFLEVSSCATITPVSNHFYFFLLSFLANFIECFSEFIFVQS